MYNGLSFTLQDAIRRHAGQAASVTTQFNTLPRADRQKILVFLESL
jgi:CxxC motif-containing protein (DUF1111 family)